MGRTKRILALILAVAMCFTFVTVASAYVDTNPNTHRNTGHHIADLIGVARTQLGYTELSTSTGMPLAPGHDGGYTKYGASFGDSTGPWCAYFVAWCASQAGIPSSVLPRLGNCGTLADWFEARSRYYTSNTGYIPKTGDIIFYNWNGRLNWEQHVGIVTGVSGDSVYTIEGNTGNSPGYRCESKTRNMGAYYIIGYGVPDYNDAETYRGSYSFSTPGRSQSIAYSTSKLAVVTTSATDITSTNAILNGSFSNAGGLYVSSYGFKFGKKKKETKKYSLGGGTSTKSVNLSMDVRKKTGEKLTPSTTYYYQSYVTISGVDYTGPMYAVVTVNDKPSQLMLSENNVNVGIGQTTELLAIPIPLGSTDKGITWESANEKIATVDNGVITGVGYGKVIVTAKANYGGVTSQCTVNVLIPAPQNVEIENISETVISLKWDKVENAKGYMIYRSNSRDGEFEAYEKSGAGKTEFVDEELEPGTRYYYKIQTLAKKEEYNSDLTEAVYTTARIAAPKNVVASNFIAASLRVTWDKVDEAKNYIVYRGEALNGLYKIVGSTATGVFVDTDIISGNNYFYRIVATNGNERTISGYSETAFILAQSSKLGLVDVQLPVPDINENLFKNLKLNFAI